MNQQRLKEAAGGPAGARPYNSLAIVGGGAWGSALALTALRAGRACRLWIRKRDIAARTRASRQSPYLPDHPLPAELRISDLLPEVLEGADLVVLVVPSQVLRGVAGLVQVHAAGTAPVLICSKGIEARSGAMMHAVVGEEMPERSWAVLSGPSFAAEVAGNQPTAVTIAAPDIDLAARVAVTFASARFRPYLSNDPLGVEVGGAVKNVLAIACGIAAGCGFGANARAALITRGLAEIKRLGDALGARRETLSGLAGLGDLSLTCSNEQSRNFSYGAMLGRGDSRPPPSDGPEATVEGVENARSVTLLAQKLGVEMPICKAVFEVLYRNLPVEEAMALLLLRPLRDESEAP